MAKKSLTSRQSASASARASAFVNASADKSAMNKPKLWPIVVGLIVALICGGVISVFATVKIWKNDIERMAATVTTTKEQVAESAPQTCMKIEALLNGRLDYSDADSDESVKHIQRANVYSALSEHGCTENADKYKTLALYEIEIARALSDDKYLEHYEVMDIVATYKNLDMEQEARQFVDTIKRITTPAVEFIQAVEKIIEE